MPNHCQNHLAITGPLDQRKQFAREAISDKQAFSIEQFVPQPPPGDPRRIADDSCQDGWDWFSWRIDNWGTKWDVYQVETKAINSSLVYTFESAWAPPLEAVRRISIAFPQLVFELAYLEAGSATYGKIIVKNEQFLDQKLHEFDYSSCDFEDEDNEEPAAINDSTLKAHMEKYCFNFGF